MQREAERDRERRARAAAAAQRNAQREAAARSRAQLVDQRQSARLYAEERVQEAAEYTAQLERDVEVLETVLAATLDVDDFLDLNELKRPPELPTFAPSAVGGLPPLPRLEDYLPAAPTGVGRVFGGAKHTQQTQQAHANYQQRMHEYQLQSQEHAGRLDAARRQYDAHVAQLLTEHEQYAADIGELQAGLAGGEPDAVVRYLDLVLEAARYPEGFPHRWQLAYTPESGQLVVEYDLPAPDVVPTTKAYKYIKSSDTINPTQRPQAQIRSLYVSIVVQTALRVVHELLESDRGAKIRTVVFNGYAHGTDPATGRDIRTCLVALATSRERFLQLDLSRIEPAACLSHLEGRLSKDPTRLVAVEPIVLSGTLDMRYTVDSDEDDGQVSRNGATQTAAAPPLMTSHPGELTPPQAPSPEVQASTAVHVLTAGQNVPLTGPRLDLRLTAGGDLSVLLVGEDGRVAQDEDFVFYNNPSSVDGAIVLRGGDNPDGATIDLARVSHTCDRVVLVVSAGDQISSVAGAALAVTDLLGQPSELAFSPVDRTHVTALVAAEVYRRHGAWRLRAVGQGWADGLAGVARDYGVDVA